MSADGWFTRDIANALLATYQGPPARQLVPVVATIPFAQ